MNKIKYIPVFLMVFLIHCSVYSQAKFSIGPELGLTMPTGDYSGSTIDYYNGTSYGLGSGINFGAVFKASLPLISVRVAANYVSLKNTGNSAPGVGNVSI